MKNILTSTSRSPLRCGFFTVAIALCWLSLSPPVQAQCPSFCGAQGANTALGNGALDALTTGIANTAVGSNALGSLTTGTHNTAIGASALANNSTGNFNMAIGTDALRDNNSNFNLAIGFRVLFQNTTGNHNTGIGAAALRNNTTGGANTAIGADAMRENTTGGTNTAVGNGALTLNTTTEFNAALGDGALGAFNGTDPNLDGANTALGSIALAALTGGTENVAVGRRALESLTNGSNNVSVGWRSGDLLATGFNNTFLGNGAGRNYNADESNNICIGNGTAGSAGESNAIRIGNDGMPSHGIQMSGGGLLQAFTIGAGFSGGGIQYLQLLGSAVSIAPNFSTTNGASSCFVGGIYNQTPTGGSHAVQVGPDNKLADATLSSRRFKKDIAPMDKASERLLDLKPVTFHWKTDVNNEPEFGLIAEEVAKVNPDWITRDPQGEVIGVRYDTIPVLLLNEFLKEHKRVQDQQASIADLKSTIALQQKEMQVLTAQLKEQAAQIQKVSAQLEASKPAPKVVANK